MVIVDTLSALTAILPFNPEMPFPNDTGPIYRETMPGRIPVEPYNTFSNLVFLVLLIYWGRKVFPDIRKQPFLAAVLPVIALSLLGGLMFHGTRSHPFWLLLDWVPIMLLSLAFVVYMIFRISGRWLNRILILVFILLTSMGLRMLSIPESLRISLGYLITALTIAIPVFVYLYKTQWKFAGWVGGAFAVFGAAVFFRTIDREQQFLSMGTHWIWHLLGGVAVHLLITFIYKDKSVILRTKTAA